MVYFLLVCFFFIFVIILPIGLFYWKIKKIDLDTEPKPVKKLFKILYNNQIFITIVISILIGIIIYLVTKY